MICSAICTKETIEEFDILRTSFNIFHPETKWCLGCDDETDKYFSKYDDIEIINKFGRDVLKKGRTNHVFYTDNLASEKLRTIELIIEKYGETIHFDTDMIFFNKMSEDIINSEFDAAYAPHYFFGKDHPVSKRVGYYNAGMIWVRSKEFFNKWKELTNSGKYFFEQKPLEVIYDMEKYNILELPRMYNYSCGNQDKNDIVMNKDGMFYVGDEPLINIHVHAYKQNIHLGPDSMRMKEIIRDLLKNSNNESYIPIKRILMKNNNKDNNRSMMDFYTF